MPIIADYGNYGDPLGDNQGAYEERSYELTGYDSSLLSFTPVATENYYVMQTIDGADLLKYQAGAIVTLTIDYTPNYTACTAPTNIQVSSTPASPATPITLSWSGDLPGNENPITSYGVMRATAVDGTYIEIEEVTARSTTVYPPAQSGGHYYFKIIVKGTAEGFDSEISAAYADLESYFTAPSAPGNLLVDGLSETQVSKGDTATLTWSPSTDGDNNPVTGYRIFVDGFALKDVTGTTAAVNPSSVYGKRLTIYIKAIGPFSASPASNFVILETYTPPIAPAQYEPVTEFMFFDKDDNRLFFRRDNISMVMEEQNLSLEGEFPYDPAKPIEDGMRIGWVEGEVLYLFEITQPYNGCCATYAVVLGGTYRDTRTRKKDNSRRAPNG